MRPPSKSSALTSLGGVAGVEQRDRVRGLALTKQLCVGQRVIILSCDRRAALRCSRFPLPDLSLAGLDSAGIPRLVGGRGKCRIPHPVDREVHQSGDDRPAVPPYPVNAHTFHTKRVSVQTFIPLCCERDSCWPLLSRCLK